MSGSRWLSIVLAAACAAGVLAVAVSGAAGRASRRTAAINRQAAARDAGELLARLRLPFGAVLVSHEPVGDAGVLALPALGQGTSDVVDHHVWWRLSKTPADVLAFVKAHRPSGSKKVTSGSGGGLRQPSSEFVGFGWPPVAGVLGTRWLLVEVVRLSDGSTGVRADAQVMWIIPRPVGEKVPVGVHEIDITRGTRGHPPSLSLHVTSRATVREIVAMIDQLPTVQPEAISCPAFPVDGPVVTFRFRPARGAPALATASEPSWVTEPTTPCDPLSITIRGRPQTPLLRGAAFLRHTERLLRVKLTTSL